MNIVNIISAPIILGGLGLIFGVCLSYASKKFEVKADETTEQIRKLLPGANCGACGFASCDAYAEALSQGKASAGACPVGGEQANIKISEFLGVGINGRNTRNVAKIMCCAHDGDKIKKYVYEGIKSCSASNSTYGGMYSCIYGCLGFGDCVKACPFDAITIENGIAKINEDKCTGCGKCVNACPKKIIKLGKADIKYHVACSNVDKGQAVRLVCKKGCISCGKCAKVCESGAVDFDGKLARIDADKCINCGKCYEACPVKCIILLDKVSQCFCKF